MIIIKGALLACFLIQRKTMTELKEKKLQDKIQLLEAKIEELEIEASTAKKYLLVLFITLSGAFCYREQSRDNILVFLKST